MSIILPDPGKKRDTLFAVLEQAPYGKTFTYEELSEIVGVPDIKKNRSIIYSVDKRLMKHANRCLANVVNVGYRVITPEEHLTRMDYRQRRSRKQARLGKLTGEATDLNQIKDPVVRKAIQDQSARMASIESQLANHRKRLTRTETLVSGQQEKSEAMDSRLKRLEELLLKQQDDEQSNGLESGSSEGDAA